jgi:hypothetical protein
LFFRESEEARRKCIQVMLVLMRGGAAEATGTVATCDGLITIRVLLKTFVFSVSHSEMLRMEEKAENILLFR